MSGRVRRGGGAAGSAAASHHCPDGHLSDEHRRARRRRRYRGCDRVLHGQPGQERRAHQQQYAGDRDAGLVPAVVAAGVPEQPYPDVPVTGGQQREQRGPTLPQLGRCRPRCPPRRRCCRTWTGGLGPGPRRRSWPSPGSSPPGCGPAVQPAHIRARSGLAVDGARPGVVHSGWPGPVSLTWPHRDGLIWPHHRHAGDLL